MANEKRFILRGNPQPPKRKKHIEGKVHMHDGMSIEDVISIAEVHVPGFKLEPAGITFEQESGYDGDEMVATYSREETDTEFKIREKSYKRRLASYSTWKKKNAKKIATELERLIEVGKEVDRDELREKEKELARMAKEVDKLREKMEDSL